MLHIFDFNRIYIWLRNIKIVLSLGKISKKRKSLRVLIDSHVVNFSIKRL